MNAQKPKVSPSIVNRISRFARADPRTVRKALAGQPVRGPVGDRIEVELSRRGLIPLALP